MLIVIVLKQGHYPRAYGPFSSESERHDLVDSALRAGYKCFTTEVEKPFALPSIELTQIPFGVEY